MRLLVVNAGSSSLKLSVLDEHDTLLAAEVLAAPGGQVDQAALKEVIAQHNPIDAVGHRIVHGGTEFTAPVLVDAGWSAVWRRCPTWPPCTSPNLCGASRTSAGCSRTCPQWRASTPPSTPPCPLQRRPMPCLFSGAGAGTCAGSGSMGSRTPMRRAAAPR